MEGLESHGFKCKLIEFNFFIVTSLFFNNLSHREETNQSIFSHNKVTVCVTARFYSNVPQKAWYQALNMAFLNSETNLKKAIKTYMYI